MIRYVFVKDDTGFTAISRLNGKNGKCVSLGAFDTQELAQEAKDFFNNECGKDIEKYKQSKYWKELRRLGSKSEGYERKGSVSKKPSGIYQAIYSPINGKHFNLGFFDTKELAKEALNYFHNECNKDYDKYKESKYWKELRRLNTQSEGYVKKGSILKSSYGKYKTTYSTINGTVLLGSFDTKELAQEAINYFVNECHENLEEYKKSKYWKELRNIARRAPEYEVQGGIFKLDGGTYEAWGHNKDQKSRIYLGIFETKELAQEAINYFLKECNADLNKFKQSKYWLEKNDRRSISKSYWEKGKKNTRNTSGITGVRWLKSQNCWEARISINYKDFYKYFHSKENAIKYRDFLVEQGKEFNENWDEARKQKQMEFIKEQSEKLAKELKNNSDEKKAIEEEKQETQYEFTKVEE